MSVMLCDQNAHSVHFHAQLNRATLLARLDSVIGRPSLLHCAVTGGHPEKQNSRPVKPAAWLSVKKEKRRFYFEGRFFFSWYSNCVSFATTFLTSLSCFSALITWISPNGDIFVLFLISFCACLKWNHSDQSNLYTVWNKNNTRKHKMHFFGGSKATWAPKLITGCHPVKVTPQRLLLSDSGHDFRS